MEITAYLSHVCPRGYCTDSALTNCPTLLLTHSNWPIWVSMGCYITLFFRRIFACSSSLHVPCACNHLSTGEIITIFSLQIVWAYRLVPGAHNHFRNSGTLPVFSLEEPESKFSSSAILPGAKRVPALGLYFLIAQELSEQNYST